MDRHPPALQHDAHRYRVRRLEAALLGVDRRAVRGPSAVAGWLLAAALTTGCALLAWVRPVAVTDAPILLDAESGTLYVRLDETLHPVLNLTSARLIAGADAVPHPVPAAVIGRSRRGPALGIPGAPQTLGTALTGPFGWAICDTGGGATAVLAGLDPPAPLDPQQAVPVTSTVSGATYLLYRGRRIAVDPGAVPAVANPVPALLLGALPEAPPNTEIPDRLAVLPTGTTLCVHWRPDDPAAELSAGLPALPTAPVGLAQADGAGPALDGVYLPPGRSAYVRAVGVSGAAGTAGARYLICDTGVRYPIDDDVVARSLGLPGEPSPVPWPMLTGLPVGPLLSRDAALRPPAR
ncbi:type VII secretion protein EccB [Mycobacterium sp. M1]|uniref:Type VII secretion protein EccB n=1 Tax=Mycolicibacter acidiphilus TaxID=2835306 RepID=A0ABS5RMW8_9MYCO|nr:type VII secretion protein EccB [Mycolicibacter acidiphilus]MBS9535645.1 type VII secretion protein EccB [Mycolicibacter acidiphilus]